LVALGEMLESIMVEEVVPGITIARMELKIKLFLTEFDLLDQQVKIVGAIPKIISSFNFMCLLNLPKATERFGPLRNLWEGGFKGEGFIGSCKKFLRFGQREGFEFNALKNVLTERALKRASKGMESGKSGTTFRGMSWPKVLAAHREDFKMYGERSNVVEVLASGGAISVVVCSFNCRSIAFAVLKDEAMVFLQPSGAGIRKMGIVYTDWVATTTTGTALELTKFCKPHQAHISFGVLLPLFGEEGHPPKHTLVRSMRYGV
jgi:hypothetical protein